MTMILFPHQQDCVGNDPGKRLSQALGSRAPRHHTYMETTRFTKPGSRRAPHRSSWASIARVNSRRCAVAELWRVGRKPIQLDARRGCTRLRDIRDHRARTMRKK